MKAEVYVTLKPSVLDPQGEAVRKAIHGMGMECVKSARIGKYIELEIDGTNLEKTKSKLDEVCHDLLSNPVIENYRVEIKP
jgi:phosphoribosylformylglycinamidine synthase subunit PurS